MARSPGFTVAPPGPGHGAAGVPGRRCQQTQTELREEPALPHPGTRETRPEDRGLCGRPSPRLPGPPGQWQPPPTGTRFPREQPIPRLQGADSLGPTRPAWQGHGRRGVPTFQSPPRGTDGQTAPSALRALPRVPVRGVGGRLQTIFDKCVKSIQRRKSSLCDKGGRAITHPQTANKQVKMGRKKRKRKEKKKKKKRKRKKERTLTLTSHLTTNGSWV